MVSLAILSLLLGLFYVLEINFIIQDSFRVEHIRKNLRELTLQNQSLAAHGALRMNTHTMEEVRERFSLTEVKVLTYLQPRTPQFSLKAYPYSERSGKEGNRYE